MAVYDYCFTFFQARDAEARGDMVKKEGNARIALRLNIAAFVTWCVFVVLWIITGALG